MPTEPTYAEYHAQDGRFDNTSVVLYYGWEKPCVIYGSYVKPYTQWHNQYYRNMQKDYFIIMRDPRPPCLKIVEKELEVYDYASYKRAQAQKANSQIKKNKNNAQIEKHKINAQIEKNKQEYAKIQEEYTKMCEEWGIPVNRERNAITVYNSKETLDDYMFRDL